MEYARQEYMRWMLIESMGIVWLTAEIIILYMVRAARDFLDTIPSEKSVQWHPPIPRILLTGILSFLFLAFITYGRHWVLPPVHAVQNLSAPDIAAIQSLFRQRYHEHMIVWSAFITAWVLLEALIVYHGWRGFLSLRQIFRLGVPMP